MKATGIILLALILSGCASTATKRQATLAKTVYAENAAIKAGRFDLANAYSRQAVKLLPPPKKPISVKPIESKGQELLIVPKADAGLNTVAINSPALLTLESQDKGIQGQLNADKVAVERQAKATDSALRAESKDAAKQEDQPSLWHKITHSFVFFGIPFLLVGGVIALCVFFPPIIPLVLAVGKDLFEIITSAISTLINFISSLWQRKQK